MHRSRCSHHGHGGYGHGNITSAKRMKIGTGINSTGTNSNGSVGFQYQSLVDVNDVRKESNDDAGEEKIVKANLKAFALLLCANLVVVACSAMYMGYGGDRKAFIISFVPYNVNIDTKDVVLVLMARFTTYMVTFYYIKQPTFNYRRLFIGLNYWSSFAYSILMIGKFVLLVGYTNNSTTVATEKGSLYMIFIFTFIISLLETRMLNIAYTKINGIVQKSIDREKKMNAEDDDYIDDPRNRFYSGGSKENDDDKSKQITLSTLAKILKPYFLPKGRWNKIRAASTFLILAISKACNILSPLYVGFATQELISDQVIPWKSLLVYCGTRLASTSLKELQKVVYLGVKKKAFSEISEMTFKHLHTLSLDWHLKKKIGHVLRIMDRGIRSADSVMNYLVLYLIPSITECMVTFTIFYIKFKSPKLAVIGFLCFVVYVVITIQITIWRKQYRRRSNASDNKYHDIATDSLMNFEAVKYFATEKIECNRFIEAVNSYQKSTVATQASLSLLNVVQQFIIQLAAFFGLVIMASQILSVKGVSPGERIGEFVSVNAYIFQLFSPLSYLGTIYSAVIQAMIDMTNLGELLQLESDVCDIPNAKTLMIHSKAIGAKVEFKNVKFKYPGVDELGVDGISFICEPGETTAIVGHTGAGKTTIGRLLYRFYDVQYGSIKIDGQDISKVTQFSLRSKLGVVSQDFTLFNESIKYNILYGCQHATEDMLIEAAKAAQIYDFIMSLDKKWETAVGDRGLKLSGGEKQRVAIARCLLRNAPVLLLDEATSALDSITEKSVQLALKNLSKGRTQIVIAHRLSTILEADNIIVLENGKIIESGNHELLMSINGIYANMWKVQIEEGNRLTQ